MTISRGNQLHVVWLEVIPGNPSVVYYVNGVSSAPAVPAQPLPEVPPDTLGLTQYARPTGTPAPTVTPAPTLVDLPYSDVQSVESPGKAVFISVGAVVVFLAIIIGIRRKKQ